MKKLLLLFICFSTASYIFSQDIVWVVDKTNYYEYINDEWKLYKREYTQKRDEYGHSVQSLIQIYEDGEWINSILKTSVFYDAHILKSSMQKSWIPSDNSWGETMLYTHYNDKGQEILFIQKYGYSAEIYDYDKGYKELFTYNSQGQVVLKIIYLWNIDSYEWELSREVNYVYDDDGYKTNTYTSYWSSNYGLLEEVRDLIYNEYGDLMQVIDYGIDSENNEWKKKLEYKWDEFGNKLSYMSSRWGFNSDFSWIYIEREEMIYNDFGELIKIMNFKWNKENAQWENNQSTEFVYDNDGKLIKMVKKNLSNDKWEVIYSEERLFDRNNKLFRTLKFSKSGFKYSESGRYKIDRIYSSKIFEVD